MAIYMYGSGYGYLRKGSNLRNLVKLVEGSQQQHLYQISTPPYPQALLTLHNVCYGEIVLY